MSVPRRVWRMAWVGALLAAASAAPALGQPVHPRNHALVIGIAQYPRIPGNALRFADADAIEFARLLRSPQFGSFDVHLLVNEEATREAIFAQMAEIGDVVEPGDVVYVFFAGHGAPDRSETVFFLPYNASDRNPAGEGIEATEFVRQAVRQMRGTAVVFFLDACYAGAAERGLARSPRGDLVGDLDALWRRELRTLDVSTFAFYAANANRQSFEDPALRHGVFSYYLIEGLRGAADGALDARRDGIVSAGELRQYLASSVRANAVSQALGPQNPTTSAGLVPEFKLAYLGSPDTPRVALAATSSETRPAPATAGSTAADSAVAPSPSDTLRLGGESTGAAASEPGSAGNQPAPSLDSRKRSYVAAFRSGYDLLQHHDTARAIAELNRAASLYDGDAAVFLFLGEAYYGKGDPARAVTYFRRALAAPGGSDESEFLRLTRDEVHAHTVVWMGAAGLALHKAGDNAAAADVLGEVTRRAPGDNAAWTNLGSALYALQRWRDLLPVAARLRELEPLNSWGWRFEQYACGNLAANGGAGGAANRARADSAYRRIVLLPVHLESTYIDQRQGGDHLVGAVEGAYAAAGTQLTLEFTFNLIGQSARTLRTVVTAPATGVRAPFDIALPSDLNAVSFSYRVVP